jgi:hypothetical protein
MFLLEVSLHLLFLVTDIYFPLIFVCSGVTRVLCEGFAHDKAKDLPKGSSVELFVHVNSSGDQDIVADNLRDNTMEPFADVMSLLETMDAYQSYFTCKLAPIQTADLEDLSPIKRKPIDPSVVSIFVFKDFLPFIVCFVD